MHVRANTQCVCVTLRYMCVSYNVTHTQCVVGDNLSHTRARRTRTRSPSCCPRLRRTRTVTGTCLYILTCTHAMFLPEPSTNMCARSPSRCPRSRRTRTATGTCRPSRYALLQQHAPLALMAWHGSFRAAGVRNALVQACNGQALLTPPSGCSHARAGQGVWHHRPHHRRRGRGVQREGLHQEVPQGVWCAQW